MVCLLNLVPVIDLGHLCQSPLLQILFQFGVASTSLLVEDVFVSLLHHYISLLVADPVALAEPTARKPVHPLTFAHHLPAMSRQTMQAGDHGAWVTIL